MQTQFRSLPKKPIIDLPPSPTPDIVKSEQDLLALERAADQAMLVEISNHPNSKYPWGSLKPPTYVNNKLVYDSFFVPNVPTQNLSVICTAIRKRSNYRVIFSCKQTLKTINNQPTKGVLVYRLR